MKNSIFLFSVLILWVSCSSIQDEYKQRKVLRKFIGVPFTVERYFDKKDSIWRDKKVKEKWEIEENGKFTEYGFYELIHTAQVCERKNLSNQKYKISLGEIDTSQLSFIYDNYYVSAPNETLENGELCEVYHGSLNLFSFQSLIINNIILYKWVFRFKEKRGTEKIYYFTEYWNHKEFGNICTFEIVNDTIIYYDYCLKASKPEWDDSIKSLQDSIYSKYYRDYKIAPALKVPFMEREK